MQKNPDSEGASLQALKGVSDLKLFIFLSLLLCLSHFSCHCPAFFLDNSTVQLLSLPSFFKM